MLHTKSQQASKFLKIGTCPASQNLLAYIGKILIFIRNMKISTCPAAWGTRKHEWTSAIFEPCPRPLAFWFQKRRFLKGFYHRWAWWPSWSCDQYNWYKFWLTYHKESSYEIEFNGPSGFWGNYVLMCWWNSNMRDLGWKVKGQPLPLKLIYFHCLIRFDISSENNDFGFNSIQKINFSKKIHLNALESKFDLDVK